VTSTRILGVIALAALAACGSSTEPGNGGGGGGNTTLPALLGHDISALERIEQAGGIFRDAGTPGDAIAILRAHGANLFRLRLFVAPNGTEVQVNDLAYTVRMAQRVKAAGAQLLLDIHYSDTWADPAHQVTPAAWAAMSLDTLEAEVERYTDSVVTVLAQAGALPDVVQVGNEVDAGMLWPLGQLEYDVDSLASWDRFTRLLRAGIRGVRSATPTGATVRVMVHYSGGANTGGTQWFFDHVVSAGVAFDLIGLSYYPFWHGTIGQLRTNLRDAAQRYGRGVMVVETAYPWRAGGWESMVTNSGAMIWGVSPQGQAGFLADVVSAVADVPGGRGLGVLWWYPESIQVGGLFAWAGGSLALFDAGGSLLPAASVFEPVTP
jgi:arabinogalactan endo-1,4-beta-galactosidase